MKEPIHKKIERYLHNEMVDEEKDIFEQKMKEDIKLKEEVHLQQSIINVFTNQPITYSKKPFNNKEVEKVKTLIKTEKYKKAYSNIKANTSNYLNKQEEVKKSINYKLLIGIAATLIIFMALFPLYKNNTNHNYYDTYANWNNIPSFIEKGNTKNILITIEKNYTNKNYTKTIELIKSLPKAEKEKQPNLQVYLGASYFHLNNYKKALNVFETFSKSKAYDSSKGYWYMLLIYLKQDELDNAKKMLHIITKNSTNYNYSKAIELLKKID